MQKLLIAVLTMVTTTTAAVWGIQALQRPASQSMATALSHLPRDLTVPTKLPAGLDDPTLLEAWVRLYNETAPVALWPGKTVSGRELAEFLREAGIPLVWDAPGACTNASCSRQFCRGAVCTFDDGQPGTDPIYIYPPHAAQMPTLVATLAHEAFHRLQPFGPVHDSIYEEFWACRLSAAFDPDTGFKFDGYDPLVSGWLPLWVRDNNLTPYFALPGYPEGFDPAQAGSAQP
jgi:hypothetical protein